MRTPRIDKLLRGAAHRKGLISFAGGLPAPETFPRNELARAAEAATCSMGATPLQYDWPEGRPQLRELIAARMLQRGARIDPEDVHITNGAQDAMALALDVLGPTDVYVDHATYPGALDVILSKRLVAMSSKTAPVWYVMPAMHNPWGWAMTAERRGQVLGAPTIIEDDAYADLCFAGAPRRPLLADAAHKTFNLGTFSKTVSPGLRVGWLIAPPRWRSALREAKARRDLQTGGLAQAMLEQLLAHPGFDGRLERLRSHYAERCERLLELLPRLPGIRFSWPEGGFSVWVETESVESDDRLLARALARGVAFDPGTMFRAEPQRHGRLSFRLSFSAVPIDQMQEGIARLAAALDEARAAKRPVAA
ncbi:MAG: PLP-dependent aminotransferase family protein [Archangiaceae bacterium]|nr:PLP-dependent aminotransferase family protein [Archangiaceae bacterium]